MLNRILLLACLLVIPAAQADVPETLKQDAIWYGVAYYDEYMPFDRLDKDIAMMKAAGINMVRIGESTWGTMEPREGEFDFSHLDRVLDAMHKAGIRVIIGTPTYAIPAWMAKQYPDVLATTAAGKNKYGARQNMDITHPDFRRLAERMIRAMLTHVSDHPAIIGYQVDNETKHYNTSGKHVQAAFVAHLKQKFGTLEAMNDAFGLNYWSNRVNSWDEFPEVHESVYTAPVTSINGSVTAAFAAFQRSLVTEYLAWQAGIVNEFKKPGQFVTQNFDLDWRGYSYGIQSSVDHFEAAAAMDIAGVDIYHPGQHQLTGNEIALGGDLARSMKDGQNYFVIETQAQGFPQWTPYPGQLTLQAFSHIASGANMVAYWHWASTHNAIETYWKGLLSQDYAENATYNEARTVGNTLAKLGDKITSLNKQNEVAVLFSNEALTAFNEFSFGWGAPQKYNDVLRPFYDSLYRANIETDFIDPSNFADKAANYKMIVIPALYSASDTLLEAISDYVKNGGHIVATFKHGFTDENVKVRASVQPGNMTDIFGIRYSQFVHPERASLNTTIMPEGIAAEPLKWWMELVTADTADVLATYEHPVWGDYAAVTRNQAGKGTATYIATMPSDNQIDALLRQAANDAGVTLSDNQFPVIEKKAVNQAGNTLHFVFNYSENEREVKIDNLKGMNLLTGSSVSGQSPVTLPPWGVVIIEEKR